MAYSNIYSNPQNYNYGWYDNNGGNGYVIIDGTNTVDNGTIIDDDKDNDNDFNYAYGNWEINLDEKGSIIDDINDIELSNIINEMSEEIEDFYLEELMDKVKDILKFKGMWNPKKEKKIEKPSHLEDELFEI